MRNLQLPVVALLAILTLLLSAERLFSRRPLLDGRNTYVTVGEIALVLVSILLTWSVISRVRQIEAAARDILLFGVKHRVRRLEESADEVLTELTRSRRHNRPLSVVVVEFDIDSDPNHPQLTRSKAQPVVMKSFANACLVRLVGHLLRRTDLILEPPKFGRVILLCPETDATGASLLVERIGAAAENLGELVTCGTATFPDEAVTFEELVLQAESKLQPRSRTARVLTDELSQRRLGA